MDKLINKAEAPNLKDFNLNRAF